MTNYNKISWCRNNGFITADQVAEKISRKYEFVDAVNHNAVVSSNDVLKIAAFDNAIALLKTAGYPEWIKCHAAMWNSFNATKISPIKRMEAAKELIAAGKKI